LGAKPIFGIASDVLFAGFAGALFVFVLQRLWELVRREQERRGIMRLIYAELRHNEQELHYFKSDPQGAIRDPRINALSVNVWHSTRARLAQLLPASSVEVLALYYLLLETLQNVARYRVYPQERQQRSELLDVILEQEKEAVAVAGKHAKRDLPSWRELLRLDRDPFG
jgi:hypothetical protein